MTLEEDILARIRPSEREHRRLDDAVQGLTSALQARLDAAGIPGEATVQGSAAKDTWLAGSTDIDAFLLLPPDIDEGRLDDVVAHAADGVLEAPRSKYAQHPYLVGSFRGFDVDLVPAYAVARPGKRLSAVDRTPFHTRWVHDHLDGRLRDAARLAKRWMKGVGVYGAETAIAGFSGYLVEVLVHHFDGFGGLVDWLAAGARDRRIAVGEDRVDDDVSPLIVVDPVDPERNCAAAVATATLDQAIEAARAYREAPDERFFFPRPPETADPARLHAALSGRRQDWLGIAFPEAAQRLDIVAPQFQKATRRIADALETAGFHVADAQTDIIDDFVGMQWLVGDRPLPASRLHEGPPADTPHADRFRDKWQDHPDNLSGVQEADGRLRVEVAIRHRTPAAWLAEHLERVPLGKHVQKALRRATVLEDPGAVLPPWSPHVTDFILQRRPWQR